MKKVYENFIQCIKDRDYESVAWILNYTDPKALYDLIFKMNLLISDVDKGPIVITKDEQQVATLSYSIENNYVSISVKFIKDEKTDCIKLMRSLYPKFQRITLTLLYVFEENAFSIDICCPLEDCIDTKFKTSALVQDTNSAEDFCSNSKRTKKFNKYLKRIVKSLYPSILIKSKPKNEIDDDEDE